MTFKNVSRCSIWLSFLTLKLIVFSFEDGFGEDDNED